jgi:hypothetical protein
MKHHSTKNDKDSDYSKGFEDLLGSQKGLSEQEKKIVEEQMAAKRVEEAQA